jgi:hypothetical protein
VKNHVGERILKNPVGDNRITEELISVICAESKNGKIKKRR